MGNKLLNLYDKLTGKAPETPTPMPGVSLVPKLLAYEIARQCEKEEVKGIVAVVMNEDGTWDVRVSSGVRACESSFAGNMIMEDALRVSRSGPEDDDEGGEDS